MREPKDVIEKMTNAMLRGDYVRVSIIPQDETLARSEWQPIESAPRDGTRVLTCYYWKGAPVYRIGFVNPRGNWVTEPGTWQYAPTHWQPLPAPPLHPGRGVS